MRAVLAAAAGLAVVFVVSAVAPAQVYRWEDARGTVHYSNTPERVPDAQRPPGASAPAAPVEAAAPAPAPPTATAAAITRFPYEPGAPILVSARIGGNGPVMLILDTGADRTMVAPQALSRLGISTANAPRAEIRGVTGSGQGEVVQVASLEVGEARVGPLRIVAHDADLSRADGLLGRDFLEHFTVTIDSRERTVTLAPK